MWCKVACMSDRDDFAELVGSARSVLKCSSLYFNGRIRYGTKGERMEERLLCMDAIRVYICSIKIPVKIESQFNILAIKLIERVSDSQVLIETDEKQTHALYGLHEKSSLQPFLIVLFRNLHAVFPHRLQAIVEIRPENESDKLLSLSNEYYPETNVSRPCGGFSLHYECASDFHQIPMHKSVQMIIDTVFAHRISREFTFREFESIVQKDWLPIISALRYNEWFRKITIENIKLISENIDEIRTVVRLSNSIRELRLINCGLRHDFCSRFNHSLSVSHIEHLDLSYNALEDKGLITLTPALHQRKSPLISINLQHCGLTHKSLYGFHTALVTNNYLLRNLQILNLAGNRIKEENCITILFQNNENILEELHLSDVEFSLESFFYSLTTVSCKLRRLFISNVKTSIPPSNSGGVKLFFTKNQTLEIVQLAHMNLSNDFLREMCDGLHANVHLNKLDLRLPGNQLESFIHDYALRFATIPSLTALDITGCEIDNEIVNFLGELKKNRKLISLHIGKIFNNIKQKNIQRSINAMKELILESNLEYFSIADSKLKEYTADFLWTLTNNVPLKILDIRGNSMSDTGFRAIIHILQMNRNLHTIFLDRNNLNLNNLEEIVTAMEENSTIQYLPIPITDIVQMKITEKDRMEKIQTAINRIESICVKNQQRKENLPSNDSLIVTTMANLARERNILWENQQQLIGDQASLDYILSCSNRPNQNTDLQPILTRTANITEVSSQLYENYIEEEERLKNDWKELCQVFQQKFIETNERLARKSYQLFKEKGIINYDDKFQEQIRTFFINSNDNMEQLLHQEISNRFITYSRQCFMNIATCLQKRAYDTTNDKASEIHKQLETAIFHTRIPHQGSLFVETTPVEHIGKSGNPIRRTSSKNNQIENHDETSTSRKIKQVDSTEYTPDPSPKLHESFDRLILDQDRHTLPTLQAKDSISTASKSIITDSPKSNFSEINEEVLFNTNDPIYGNVQGRQPLSNEDISLDDEGDLIEHDLLSLVQEEEQKDIPPALPVKIRALTSAAILTPHENNSHLDLHIEPTSPLVHPGKDRPRRANIRRPLKKFGNSGFNNSSFDDDLLTEENDDVNQNDVLVKTSNNTSSLADSQISESSTPAMAKFIKSTGRPLKPINDESSITSNKQPIQLPTPHPRPSSIHAMSRSMTISNTESLHNSHSNLMNESLQNKPSMSTSSYATLVSANNTNEQKDKNNSTESVTLSPPSVSPRVVKIGVGARVLPVPDSHGDGPPVKLRHFQGERKGALNIRTPSIDQTSDGIIDGTGNTAISTSPTSNTVESNEQYKPLTVKERARMLSTTIPSPLSNDKKSTTTNASSTPPYTPRTYRRLVDQVNLFC